MLKNKKENRVSKRVSIKENDHPVFDKNFNHADIQSRSVLVSLDIINESTEEEKNIFHTKLRRESCFDHKEKSCMRKKVLKKDVYLEIDVMQKEQLKIRGEIAKFRKQTKKIFRLKQEQIQRLREQIESSYNSPNTENFQQRSHINVMEELQHQLYGLQKQIHCLSVQQNELINDRQLAISQLQEQIEYKKSENFEHNLNNQILLKRIDELSDRRTQLIYRLQQNQRAIINGEHELAKIKAERQNNKPLESTISVFNYRQYTNQMKLAELQNVHADLIRKIKRSKRSFDEELESTKNRYQNELINMRQIIDTSLWWKQKTSHHSMVQMNCLLDEDMMGDFIGSQINSIWRRMPSRRMQKIDLSSLNSGIIGEQSQIVSKPYVVAQVVQTNSQIASQYSSTSVIIEVNEQQQSSDLVKTTLKSLSLKPKEQSSITSTKIQQKLQQPTTTASKNSLVWILLGASAVAACGYFIIKQKQ